MHPAQMLESVDRFRLRLRPGSFVVVPYKDVNIWHTQPINVVLNGERTILRCDFMCLGLCVCGYIPCEVQLLCTPYTHTNVVYVCACFQGLVCGLWNVVHLCDCTYMGCSLRWLRHRFAPRNPFARAFVRGRIDCFPTPRAAAAGIRCVIV